MLHSDQHMQTILGGNKRVFCVPGFPNQLPCPILLAKGLEYIENLKMYRPCMQSNGSIIMSPFTHCSDVDSPAGKLTKGAHAVGKQPLLRLVPK